MRLLLTVTSCWLVLSLNAQMIGLTVEIDTVFYEATEPHPSEPNVLLFEDLDGFDGINRRMRKSVEVQLRNKKSPHFMFQQSNPC